MFATFTVACYRPPSLAFTVGEISLAGGIVFSENEEKSIVAMFITIVLFCSLLNEGIVDNSTGKFLPWTFLRDCRVGGARGWHLGIELK